MCNFARKACENGLRLSNPSELDCVRLAPSLTCEINNKPYIKK